MQNNCVFIISYLMFWFNCYLHSVHSKKQLVSNICLTRDFQLTYDFNTAKLVYGECREHSTWQNRQMPKRPYPQHFSQMDIVVKVQWTASRETQNSVVWCHTVFEVLIRQVCIHKPDKSHLTIEPPFKWKFLCCGQHVVLSVNTNIMEEQAASICKVEELYASLAMKSSNLHLILQPKW